MSSLLFLHGQVLIKVPVRYGSVSVAVSNYLELHGTPLFEWGVFRKGCGVGDLEDPEVLCGVCLYSNNTKQFHHHSGFLSDRENSPCPVFDGGGVEELFQEEVCTFCIVDVAMFVGVSVDSRSQLMMMLILSSVNSAAFFLLVLEVFLARNPMFPRVGCLLILTGESDYWSKR